MAATIKDIARHLNISVSTVSYALNGGPRPVPEKVRDAVHKAAAELGYRPNRIARSLITNRTFTVAIVPPGIGANMFLGPYTHLTINGVVNVAQELRYDVMMLTRDSFDNPTRLANDLLDGRVDGAIFLAPHESPVQQLLMERSFPYVVISAQDPNGAPSFLVNNEGGIELAMQHLWDLGHRKFGHIAGIPDHDDAISRERSFRGFLQRHGVDVRPEWVRTGWFTIDGGERAALELLSMENRPTALVCANDEVAVGAIATANRLGLRVPDDLSIVGFDDSPVSRVCFPRLTTIGQPIGDLGSAAMRALAALIDGQADVQGQRFSTRLLVRESTQRPKEDTLQ